MQVWDFFVQGGPIMYILLLLNILGFAIIFAKIHITFKSRRNLEEVSNKLVAEIKQNMKGVNSAQIIIEACNQEVSAFMDKLQSGINAIRMIANIAPLLGLLGTVIGVLMAFRVISQSGMNDPAYFASGISMALITTVGGLIVAIPHYIAHSYLLGILDNIEGTLTKKILPKVISA